MMKTTRLALAIGFVLVSGGCAPDHLTGPAARQPEPSGHAVAQWTASSNPPLFVVNGNVVQPAAARNIDRNAIASVEVLKGAAAVERFGQAAENGVVVITLKGAATVMMPPAPSAPLPPARTAVRDGDPPTPQPIFVIDGRLYRSGDVDIDPKDIARIDVLKGPAAVERFGAAGENGAVLITLKHPASSQQP